MLKKSLITLLYWILTMIPFAPLYSFEENPMDGSPVVLILRGPPGIGKTAVSLVLKEKLSPAARINIDMLRYLVTPRNFSPKFLRAIKLNAGNLAGCYGTEGISSIIESAFTSEEIVEELNEVIRSYGLIPYVFTLVADEETVKMRNLQREIYFQTDPKRVEELYKSYNWDVGHKIFVEGKEIEEVAEDILMHLQIFRSQISEPIPDMDQYILFLRHGEAPNHPNIFLSDYDKSLSLKGEVQAKQINRTVILFAPDEMYCSPFLRTEQTARYACKDIALPLQFEKAFIERTFPILYNKTREQIAREYSGEVVEKLATGQCDLVSLPGCESLEEAQLRVVAGFEKILHSPGSKKKIYDILAQLFDSGLGEFQFIIETKLSFRS